MIMMMIIIMMITMTYIYIYTYVCVCIYIYIYIYICIYVYVIRAKDLEGFPLPGGISVVTSITWLVSRPRLREKGAGTN